MRREYLIKEEFQFTCCCQALAQASHGMRPGCMILRTEYKCFDGSYLEEKDEKRASQLQDPIVFHVNLEQDGLLYGENDPLRAMGLSAFSALINLTSSYNLSTLVSISSSAENGPVIPAVILCLQPQPWPNFSH